MVLLAVAVTVWNLLQGIFVMDCSTDFDFVSNVTSWGPPAAIALPEDALNASASRSDRLYLFVNFLEPRSMQKKPTVAPTAGPDGAPIEDLTGFVVKDSVAPTHRRTASYGGRGGRMTQSGPRQQTGQPTAPRPQFRSGGPSHMIDKTPKARPQDPGVQITPEWELIETFDIPSLSKLAVNVPAVEDLKWTGRLAAYDAKVDLTTVARSRAVQSHPEKVHVYTRVKQDPTMMEMAVEGIAKVFVTDAVLAHLMTGNKTMNPWDIMFMYLGGTIFIDVREQDKFEKLSVHETSNRQPTEDGDALNSTSALVEEATRVCADYSQDVLLASDASPAGEGARVMGLKMEDIEYWNPADFPGKSHASVAYRYRKWNFPDVSVVVRSKVNAVDIGKKKLLTTFALTEWDARYSGAPVWRSNLDARKGQVLGSEIRNNNAKFSRWMAQTLLAGADEMRVGFVSRTKPTSRVGHTLLGVQSFTPATAMQMFSMNQTNMWGILKWSIDLVKTQAAARRGDTPDDEFVCKFVLVRDPSRAVVSLYSIPPNMFEPDEEEGEDDEAEA